MPERRLPIIALFVLSLAFCAPALADDSDEQILTALLHDFLAGASRGDISVHERFWADDLVYTSSSGARTTKQAIIDGMRDAADAPAGGPYVIYSAEDISIRRYDEAAVVAFRLVATPQPGATEAKMNYFNTGTFLKRDGEWRAVAWQATIIPAD